MYTRSFLDDLLVVTLKTALALAEVSHVPLLVAKDLDLDVTRSGKVSGVEQEVSTHFSTRREPSPKCFFASLLHMVMIWSRLESFVITRIPSNDGQDLLDRHLPSLPSARLGIQFD